MLHLLPAEVALHAVSYLPLQSLYHTALVSRAWNDLIVINENTVYRNAALLHQFVGADELHAHSVAQCPNTRPINWKSICARQLQIERGWRGKAPATVKELTSTGSAVHRIKVDDKYGFTITTCQTGGLLVTDIKDNKVLWALSPAYVVNYAHCEYDHGYIIFNRHDNCKEVWRHSVDIRDEAVSEDYPPDEQMRNAYADASSKFQTGRRKGQFTPWSLLRMPEITRAFRFSYPTLLASATHNAYLWDVPKARLVETIRDIQQVRDGNMLGRINYVEVNDRYAFLCGSFQFRIFAREGGALVFHLATKQLSRQSWDIVPSYDAPHTASTILEPQMLQEAFHVPSSTEGEFMALHVSSSGKDIAALTSSGLLVLIPGFECVFSGEVALGDVAIQVNLRSWGGSTSGISIYLALGERDGKIAVATKNGLYAISPDLQFSSLTAERPPHPGITVCRLSKFDEPGVLSLISCLQITHSGIYFNYKPARRTGLRQPNAFGMAHALNAIHAVVQQQQNAGAPVADEEPHEGPDGDIPVLEPAVPDNAEEDEVHNPPPPPFDDDEEDEEDDDDDDDDDDVFEVDDPVEADAFAVDEDDQIGAMHILVNEWFLPINISTVYSVTF
ncbi:hypothetical protein F5I97DRAFT_495561 [Phlebopus sp. FC_14]|nr:hypothetical protein F5I97DRAFT_495561 [Phlebopus sp. FC_14]